jgi:hypothetical protein
MENPGRFLDHSRLDHAGALVSSVCAIHCLALPLLITVLPWVGVNILLNRSLELLFISGSLFLATASFCWGYRLHREIRLLLALYVFTAMIVAGKAYIGGSLGLWLAVLGALGLAAGHLFNRRLCDQCGACHDHGG